MKQLFMLLVFLFTGLSSFSQNAKFWYDASGNRTSRKRLLEFKSGSGFNKDEKKPVETFTDKIGETTILIFPNPVESQISIEIQGLEETDGDMISLVDQTGRPDSVGKWAGRPSRKMIMNIISRAGIIS